MARARSKAVGGDWLFPQVATQGDAGESSLLDVIDNVLNHGVVLQGEIILGVANVDLIYAKLSVLLAALDKVPLAAGISRRPVLPRNRRNARKYRRLKI